MPDVDIRDGADGDLADIARIAIAAGQHEDWSGRNPAYARHLMAHGQLVVAVVAGQVTGFGATQRIGLAPAAITVLSDLFVDPAAHGGGVGRAMLAELWRDAPRRMTFSSLHSHALPLYTSFGLDAWWPLLYLRGDPCAVSAPHGWAVTTATAEEVGAVERSWTGADRTADHVAWAARPNGAPLLASRGGQVMSAGTAAGPGGEFGLMHLAVHPAADDATALGAVLSVLAGLDVPDPAVADPAVTVCLPAPHPAVRPLLAAGWRIVDRDLYMASEPGLFDPRRGVPSPGHG